MSDAGDPEIEPPDGVSPLAAASVSAPAPQAPEPRIARRRWNVSLIWLVPAVALVVGLSLVVRAWTSHGPRIQIVFQTAEGLEAGKTLVRYKNVVIGAVTAIRVADDRTRVVVTVDLGKSAEAFTRTDTRYWVVRPRIGTAGVSGIDTLLSGAFIGADVGRAPEEQGKFVGLETPPAVTYGAAGRQFTLHADDLGSLDIGSPVYFRRIRVGRIVGTDLDADGRGVALQVFVDAPNDRFVTRATRFWNASGIDVSLGANGLKVDTESIATLLAGGVAFQLPQGAADTEPAPENTVFALANDEKTALTPAYGEPIEVVMRFDQSLRGLAVDAPVDFHGIEIGRVVSIDADYDREKKSFPMVVGTQIYPRRLGAAFEKLMPAESHEDKAAQSEVIGMLVSRTLRAQARYANLLTGQLYIALDFMPGAKKVASDIHAQPVEIPTVPGSIDTLQEQLAGIADRIEKIPFDTIGLKLDADLGELQETLKQVNAEVLPGAKATLESAQRAVAALGETASSARSVLSDDAAWQQNLSQTMQELQRSARSLRALTDYLSRHPDSLLRGRRADAPLTERGTSEDPLSAARPPAADPPADPPEPAR